jgi:hypothetical protein
MLGDILKLHQSALSNDQLLLVSQEVLDVRGKSMC